MAIAARRYIEVEVTASKALRALGAIEKSSAETERRMASLQRSVNRVGIAFRGWLAYLGAGQFTQFLDQSADVIARLRGVTGSAEGSQAAFLDLLQVSNRFGVSVNDLSASYVKLGTAIDGIGHEELIQSLTTISRVLSTTGATTQQVNAVLLQLSQALGSGALQGDEFRAVNENAPVLLRAWRDALGETGKALKDMSADADFTTESFIRLNEQIDQNIIAMTGMTEPPLTVSRALQILNNNVLALFVEMRGGAHEFDAMAVFIKSFADSLRDMAPLIVTVTNSLSAMLNVADTVGGALSNLARTITDILQSISSIFGGGADDVQDYGSLLEYTFTVFIPNIIFAAGEGIRAFFRVLGLEIDRFINTAANRFEIGVTRMQLAWAKFRALVEEFTSVTSIEWRTRVTELTGALEDQRRELDDINTDYDKQRDSIVDLMRETIEEHRIRLETNKAMAEYKRKTDAAVDSNRTLADSLKDVANEANNAQSELEKVLERVNNLGKQRGAENIKTFQEQEGVDLTDVYFATQSIGSLLARGEMEKATRLLDDTAAAMEDIRKEGTEGAAAIEFWERRLQDLGESLQRQDAAITMRVTADTEEAREEIRYLVSETENQIVAIRVRPILEEGFGEAAAVGGIK